MTASTSDDDVARLTTFKTLVESRAKAMAEDLERGLRVKRPVPLIGARVKRLSQERFGTNPLGQETLLEYNQIQFRTQRIFNWAVASTAAGTLMLEEFYQPPKPGQLYTETVAELMATMLAARAESNGRVYLNSIEGEYIATALERTGTTLLSMGLPHLAEESFDQAANLHGRFKNTRAEDRCEFLKSRTHGKTYPWWKPMRMIFALSGALFGYGYKPLRLLIWIAVVIAAFTAYMLHLPREADASRSDAFFMAIQNFVNPMGLGDAKAISPNWERALEVETYTGDILRNIFFVLLIRKWFRL